MKLPLDPRAFLWLKARPAFGLFMNACHSVGKS
jgi:hypothetical protein